MTEDGVPRDEGAPDHADPFFARNLKALRAPLTRFLGRNSRDGAEVEDLVQDVYVRVLRHGGFETVEHLTGYTFRTAASVLKDRQRKRVARSADLHVDLDPDMHVDTAPGVDSQLIAGEALRYTSLILMELPEKTRAIFILRRLDECSFAEIARRLSISVSSAEKHMRDAVQHLLVRSREGF